MACGGVMNTVSDPAVLGWGYTNAMFLQLKVAKTRDMSMSCSCASVPNRSIERLALGVCYVAVLWLPF